MSLNFVLFLFNLFLHILPSNQWGKNWWNWTHFSTQGSIAYVPQEAWIQNATLRDNILFGKTYNEVNYSEIVEGCALEPDFEILSAGDLTEIGEKVRLNKPCLSFMLIWSKTNEHIICKNNLCNSYYDANEMSL